MILVIAVPPACRLCQRRRDLAQQHLDDCRELAPLSCSQFDARSLGLRAAQKSELAMVIEVLLREIAAALAKAANGGSGDDQDHD